MLTRLQVAAGAIGCGEDRYAIGRERISKQRGVGRPGVWSSWRISLPASFSCQRPCAEIIYTFARIEGARHCRIDKSGWGLGMPLSDYRECHRHNWKETRSRQYPTHKKLAPRMYPSVAFRRRFHMPRSSGPGHRFAECGFYWNLHCLHR